MATRCCDEMPASACRAATPNGRRVPAALLRLMTGECQPRRCVYWPCKTILRLINIALMSATLNTSHFEMSPLNTRELEHRDHVGDA